jgi:putative membrane protein
MLMRHHLLFLVTIGTLLILLALALAMIPGHAHGGLPYLRVQSDANMEVPRMFQMHDGWGWWMVFGWIWMVVFWGLIIWAVVTLLTYLDTRGSSQRPSTAATILEERFARGEIDREQFEEMRKTLRGD